jgi:phosphatidylglycerol:prolipoprotein diacylglycerol transferase
VIPHPRIDPVAIAVGPLQVHWYGLMYLAGFAAGWWLGRRRARQGWRGFRVSDVDDLVFFVILGILLGGRLGYLLFYGLERLASDPAYAFRLWEGGMSFHGGLIGVIVAMAWFARSRGVGFWQVADFVAPLVPPGLFAGRIGNFINGNLWGAPTDLPWGVLFPSPAAGAVPRHPTQLYEALLEGVVLFVLLWLYSRSARPLRCVSGLFLLAYGVMRFAVEFVRVPDAHIGYLAFDWLTMGQVLTAPMILVGVALVALGLRRGEMPTAVAGAGGKVEAPRASHRRRRRGRKDH